MLPLLLHIRAGAPGRRKFRLWFPIFIIWAILAVLMIALLPAILAAALITLREGPGFRLFLVYPLLAALLWGLGGLTIDVDQKDGAVLIDLI